MKKSKINVGAYVPKNEECAILIPIVGTAEDWHFAGLAARRGDKLYGMLKSACRGKPVWLFDTSPQTPL